MAEPAGRGWLSALALAFSSVISIGAVISAKADDDDLRKDFHSDGVQITPSGCPAVCPPDRRSRPLNPGLSFRRALPSGRR